MHGTLNSSDSYERKRKTLVTSSKYGNRLDLVDDTFPLDSVENGGESFVTTLSLLSLFFQRLACCDQCVWLWKWKSTRQNHVYEIGDKGRKGNFTLLHSLLVIYVIACGMDYQIIRRVKRSQFAGTH